MITEKNRFLENETKIKVPFSAVDAMNVVWHGNYYKFFEHGRDNLAEEHGLSYLDFYNKGFFAPIVHSEIDHSSTATYGDTVLVKTRLIDSLAAKIIHDYEVINLTTNKIAATGRTVQVFVNLKKELHLTIPYFYAKWKSNQHWKVIQ